MIKLFQTNTIEELVNQMNEFEKSNKVFATNFFQPTGFQKCWYGLCFYNPLEKAQTDGTPKGEVKKDTYTKSSPPTPMTDKQAKFIKTNEKKLRQMGFDIDNIQSKSDAFKIIKQYKETDEK